MCQANGYFVFLDLKQDEYSVLDREKSKVFASIIDAPHRHKHSTDSVPTESSSEAATDLAALMLQEGILTTDRNGGKDAKPPEICMPTAALLAGEMVERNHRRSIDGWNFFVSCFRTSIALRWERLDKTVARTEKRKLRHAGTQAFDFDRTRKLVADFNALRPFYPRAYLCLFDSLALIEFLARYQVFPTWVYGVRTEPFNAHCWIQHDRFAFNESVDVIHTYTPIMAV